MHASKELVFSVFLGTSGAERACSVCSDGRHAAANSAGSSLSGKQRHINLEVEPDVQGTAFGSS